MAKVLSGIIPVIFVTIFCIISIGQCVSAKLEWDNEIGYAWDLADRSSTLSEKNKYMDEFISKVKDLPHEKNAALSWKTRENSFDLNLKALETLGVRLREVQKLDINSFAYQTAIQQITAQEQGEAGPMIEILRKAWVLDQYWWAFETVQVWIWTIWAIALCWFGAALLWKALE